MVFHLGALLRLNELGLLRGLKRVSGVSGGSMTAGLLGICWCDLQFPDGGGVATNLGTLVIEPIERFATRRIDVLAAAEGVLLPGVSPAGRIDATLNRHLYHGATLQDLPTDTEGPPLHLQRDQPRVGGAVALLAAVRLGLAGGQGGEPGLPGLHGRGGVGRVSAVFAPLELHLRPEQFEPGTGDDLEQPAYQRTIRLADGGVYDNLGLETVFKAYETVFVSDGGGQVADDPAPPADWVRETLRMTSLIDHQVRSLRKRLLMAAYQRHDRRGAYWGIRQAVDEFDAPGRLPCPYPKTLELANLPTRLDGMPAAIRRRLVNWGYAVTDASLRARYDPSLPEPPGFPYPGGVG